MLAHGLYKGKVAVWHGEAVAIARMRLLASNDSQHDTVLDLVAAHHPDRPA